MINFASAAGGHLQIAGSAMPGSTIAGFVAGDTFDLASIAFDSTSGSADLVTSGSVHNQLQITENGTTYIFSSTRRRISPAIFSTSPATGASVLWSPRTTRRAIAAAR
jgi:hypothetical protein